MSVQNRPDMIDWGDHVEECCPACGSSNIIVAEAYGPRQVEFDGQCLDCGWAAEWRDGYGS